MTRSVALVLVASWVAGACGHSHATPVADAAPEVDAPPAVCGVFPGPPQQGGRTWVVDPNGDDTAAGTDAAPLRTIQAAVSQVSPGDTVIVNDGTYSACVPDSTGSCAIASLSTGGTAASWVWIHARDPLAAKLVGSGTTAIGFDLANGVGYVRIEGFDISALDGTAGAAGVDLANGGHDVEVLRNHLHDIGRTCTDTIYGITGVFTDEPNVRIEANHFDHIGRLGPGENGCAPTTDYWQNHDHGVYIDNSGATNIVVVNNVFEAMTRGWGVQLYGQSPLSAIHIVFNTFVGANPNFDGAIVIAPPGLSDSELVANAFSDPRNSAIWIENNPTSSDLTIDENLTNAPYLLSDACTDDGDCPYPTVPDNVVATAPMLVDPTNGNFLPAAGSPLVDAATARPDVARDYLGCPRPTGAAADIGAFELQP